MKKLLGQNQLAQFGCLQAIQRTVVLNGDGFVALENVHAVKLDLALVGRGISSRIACARAEMECGGRGLHGRSLAMNVLMNE